MELNQNIVYNLLVEQSVVCIYVSSRQVAPSEEALAGSIERRDLLFVQIEPTYSHTSLSNRRIRARKVSFLHLHMYCEAGFVL